MGVFRILHRGGGRVIIYTYIGRSAIPFFARSDNKVRIIRGADLRWFQGPMEGTKPSELRRGCLEPFWAPGENKIADMLDWFNSDIFFIEGEG